MMKITLPNISSSEKKTEKSIIAYQKYLTALNHFDLSDEVVQEIQLINTVLETIPEKKRNTAINRTQLKVMQLVEKTHGLIPKKYYQNMWTSLGMACFGVPIGVSFGLIINNLALLSVGLPIGMLIGNYIGKKKDQQAFIEGRQIDCE